MADASSAPGTLQMVSDRGNTCTTAWSIGNTSPPAANRQIDMSNVVTITSGAFIGLDQDTLVNPASASTATYQGVRGSVTVQTGFNTGELRAVEGYVERNAAGTTGTASHFFAQASGSAGTITNARVFNCAVTQGVGLTTTNFNGFYFTDPGANGTITNEYGMYIENVNRGATLNRSIYIAGGRLESLDAITTTADTQVYVPWGAQGQVQNSAVSFSVQTDGTVNVVAGGNAPAGLLYLPLPRQERGQACTLQSCTVYFANLSGTAYIDSLNLFVLDVTTGTQTNIDNHTTDITSGTSYAFTGLPRAFSANEALCIYVLFGGAGITPATLRGAAAVYDTT